MIFVQHISPVLGTSKNLCNHHFDPSWILISGIYPDPCMRADAKKKDWNRDRNGCESSTGNAMLFAARSIQGCVPFGSWETIPCSPRHGQDVTLLHIVTWPSLDTLKIINWLGQNTVSSCTFWLVVDLPLWKMMEFVSWDYDIPHIWKVIKNAWNILKPPTRIEVLK